MKNNKLIWIAGTIFLIISIAVGIFAFSFLRSGLFAKPEIIILQPTVPKTINNSEGILLIVQGRSKNGISRIVFNENGILKVNKYPEIAGADEILAQIVWMPDRVGIYELSFIAYDSRDTASDPAVISIGVISDGLSQIEVDNTEAAVANSSSSNSASASGSSQVSNDSNSEGAAGINEGGEGEEEDNLEFIQADDDVNLNLRPIDSDFPPEITTFEKDLQRDGNSVLVSVQVTAQDDIGIDTIFILAYSDSEQGAPPIQVAHSCLGETHCSANASALLGEGNYDLIAFALDTIGQESSIHDQRIEISADQPPALLVDGPRLDISADFLDNLFIYVERGIIHSNPHINAGFIEIIEQVNEDDCPPNCPISTFDDVNVEIVDQYYYNNYWPKISARLVIPPRMETEYENPDIYAKIGEDSSASGRLLATRFTQEVYENGKIIEHEYGVVCGNRDFQFFPVLQTEDGTEILGTPTNFTPLLCAMKPPKLIQLKATQNCPDNSDYCLIVTWEIPPDDPSRPQTDHFVLIEKEYEWYGVNEEEFIFSPDETTYINSNILHNRVYEYFLFSESAEGLHSQRAKLNIRIPSPTDNPERTTTDWQESR